MALFECVDCRHMISDRASACPHCGCPVNENTIRESNLRKQTEEKTTIKSGISNCYAIEYQNENEFRKKERVIKKYNMLAYKKLIFEYYPAFRQGNFNGTIVSEKTKEGITKYELNLPTDSMFARVHGNMKLHYTVYKNEKKLYLIH